MLTIGKIKNIPIRLSLDWLAFIIIFAIINLVSKDLNYTGQAMLAVFALSLIILLHELGHALMAKHLGFKTDSITLHCIGGMAQINKEDFPRLVSDPHKSLLVWFAGPSVNIWLSILSFLITPFIHNYPVLLKDVLFFATINAGIAIFNLIPVFPLDGGVILYSGLRIITDKIVASRITKIVGVIGGGSLLIFSIVSVAPIMGIISLFIILRSWKMSNDPDFGYVS